MLFTMEGTLRVEKAQPRTSVVTATAQGCPRGEGPGAVQEEVGFRWATGPEDEWDLDVQDRGALRRRGGGRGRGRGRGDLRGSSLCTPGRCLGPSWQTCRWLDPGHCRTFPRLSAQG